MDTTLFGARAFLWVALAATLLIASATGCAVHDALSRVDACADQADAWCDAAEPRPVNCSAVYARRCGASPDDIGVDEQDACLDSIADGVSPWWEEIPAECTATW